MRNARRLDIVTHRVTDGGAMPGKLVGQSAMTAAERQRRYRARRKAARAAATQPADQNDQAAQANQCISDAVAAPPAGMPGADYPRMLYHPDGRTTIAETPEDHDRLMADGWETIPLAVHLQRPVTHHGFLGASNDHPLATIIREVMRQVLDEYDLSDFVTPEVSKRFGEI
jgi:hypothetical protein